MTGGLSGEEANALIANLFDNYTKSDEHFEGKEGVKVFNQEPNAFDFDGFIAKEKTKALLAMADKIVTDKAAGEEKD
jgi:hypothetical protein